MNKIMLHPHFIKFEEQKNELYLTLSALIKDDYSQKNITAYQNQIMEIIEDKKYFDGLEIINDRQEIKTKIREGKKFIYKYHPETFHFSIANFLTFDILLEHFYDSRKVIEKTKVYNDICERMNILKNNLQNNFTKLEIRKIYLVGGVEGSLSLSVYPDDNFWNLLKKYSDKIIDDMNSNNIPHNFEIKSYPKPNFQYFALNIFRFIDKKESHFEQQSFYEEIEKINENLEKLTIKAKICSVVSDPYLSNAKPQIE